MNKKTIKRLMSYILKYRVRFVLVFVCIIISSLANVSASLFIGTLIDDYITPLLIEANPVYDGLIKAIIIITNMFCIFYPVV